MPGRRAMSSRRQLDGSLPDCRQVAAISLSPMSRSGRSAADRRRRPAMSPTYMASSAHRLARALRRSRATTMRILYGGSVKPANAKELLAVENVDGALVGGASLDGRRIPRDRRCLPLRATSAPWVNRRRWQIGHRKCRAGSCRDARDFLYGARSGRVAHLSRGRIRMLSCHYCHSSHAGPRPDRRRPAAEIGGRRAGQFDQRLFDRAAARQTSCRGPRRCSPRVSSSPASRCHGLQALTAVRPRSSIPRAPGPAPPTRRRRPDGAVEPGRRRAPQSARKRAFRARRPGPNPAFRRHRAGRRCRSRSKPRRLSEHGRIADPPR